MKMKKIIRALELARDEYDYGYVEVTIPGQEGTEIIINSSQSLNNKIAFYKKAYDENGVHCMNNAVKIVAAGAVSELSRVSFSNVDVDEEEKKPKYCSVTHQLCDGDGSCEYAE